MTKSSVDQDLIRAIAELLNKEDLAEIEIEQEDLRVRVTRSYPSEAPTYAHALRIFGESDLVDFIELMAQHAHDATLLIAFQQQLPAGQEPLLPIL